MVATDKDRRDFLKTTAEEHLEAEQSLEQMMEAARLARAEDVLRLPPGEEASVQLLGDADLVEVL